MAKNNTEFKYEVVATYAEKDTLKVRSVSFNDRDPKFDIRNWYEKDGGERMGKGISLTIEELQYLAEELPKVVANLVGDSVEAEEDEEDSPEDDSEDDSPGLSEKADKLVKYLVGKAPDPLKGVTISDGITYVSNGHMACALKGNGDFAKAKKDIKKVFDKGMPEKLTKVKADTKKISNETKLNLKNGTVYSFGAKYKVVDATYLGKAIRAVGENATVSTDASNNVYVVKGNDGTVLIGASKGTESKVGLIKAA